MLCYSGSAFVDECCELVVITVVTVDYSVVYADSDVAWYSVVIVVMPLGEVRCLEMAAMLAEGCLSAGASVGWVPIPCHVEIIEPSSVVGRWAAETDLSYDIVSLVDSVGSHVGGGPFEPYMAEPSCNVFSCVVSVVVTGDGSLMAVERVG